MIYSDIVCHIGRNNYLDFTNLYNFLWCFFDEDEYCLDIDDSNEDSNSDVNSVNNNYVKLFRRLHNLQTKIKKNSVLEEDAKDFRQFLFDIFDDCIPTTGEFICEDEYGHTITFKEIINKMATCHEGIKFKAYDSYGYIMDGLYVDNSTDFF